MELLKLEEIRIRNGLIKLTDNSPVFISIRGKIYDLIINPYISSGGLYEPYKIKISRQIFPNKLLDLKGCLYVIPVESTSFSVGGITFQKCKSLNFFAGQDGTILIPRYGHGIYTVAKQELTWRGYYRVCIRGKKHYSHRVIADAWLDNFCISENWQDKSIDHIDTNRINNKVENLQIVTNTENQQLKIERIKSNDIGQFELAQDIIWD